jgi:anti-sigma factor RsiW
MKICPEPSRLTAFREGWLEGDEARELQEHLSHCEMCREIMAGLDEIVELLASHAASIEPPPGGYGELLNAALLMQEKSEPLQVRSAPRWMWQTVAAAAMIMIALTAYTILDSTGTELPMADTAVEEDVVPDWLVEEHALATETLPFSDGPAAVLMASKR